MRIPLDMLDAETLRRVIEEYVTRDGTDHSDLAPMVAQVRRQLETGKAELHFDEDEGATTIVPVRKTGA